MRHGPGAGNQHRFPCRFASKTLLEFRYYRPENTVSWVIVLCRKGEAMKRIILALTFLLTTSSVASAQFTPSKENLRGLTGVRLIVMFDRPTRAEAFDEVKRPGVLKMLEDDTKAKLEKAGIPFSRSQFADE